jgi:hypothetical protein
MNSTAQLPEIVGIFWACRGCGDAVYPQRCEHGDSVPLNRDGTCHWETCPAAGPDGPPGSVLLVRRSDGTFRPYAALSQERTPS